MITQSELKKQIHYSPETGLFKRLISKTSSVNVGDKAGSLRTNGYLAFHLNNKLYYSHRLAFLYMSGRFPIQVDHINHSRTDNRWINIREANASINSKNRSLKESNISGTTGVHFAKHAKMWRAQIQVKSKMISLGYFENKIDAIIVRKMAEYENGFHFNHGRI